MTQVPPTLTSGLADQECSHFVPWQHQLFVRFFAVNIIPPATKSTAQVYKESSPLLYNYMYKLLFNRMLTITNLFVIYILYFTPNNYLHKNLLLSLGGVVVFRYVVAGNVSGKSWGQVTSHPPITVLTVDQKINKYRQEQQIWRTSKIKSTCTHQIISSNITRFGLFYLPVIAKLA